MPGGAGRAAAQGPRGPSVRTPAAGHGVGRCCPAPSAPRPDPGRRPKSGGGGEEGRKERGSRDREARAAPLSGPACRRSRRGWPGYPGAADLVSGALGSGGPRCRPTVGAPSRAVAGWCWGDSPPPTGPRGAERRQKKGPEPGSAVRAPRPALSAARAPSPAPHAPARAPRPPASLSTPAPHTGAQPAGQTTGTPTPTAPPPRGASC